MLNFKGYNLFFGGLCALFIQSVSAQQQFQKLVIPDTVKSNNVVMGYVDSVKYATHIVLPKEYYEEQVTRVKPIIYITPKPGYPAGNLRRVLKKQLAYPENTSTVYYESANIFVRKSPGELLQKAGKQAILSKVVLVGGAIVGGVLIYFDHVAAGLIYSGISIFSSAYLEISSYVMIVNAGKQLEGIE